MYKSYENSRTRLRTIPVTRKRRKTEAGRFFTTFTAVLQYVGHSQSMAGMGMIWATPLSMVGIIGGGQE